ncbi:MAG: hypothetical protein WC264_03675 [Candidatus Paceibacterota bacterium]|jgi:hypothetical protein
MRKNFKNSIIGLFVIISMTTMPFLSIKKANAQSASGYVTPSATGIISSLAPAILKFPGCKKHAKQQAMVNLFKEEGITPQYLKDLMKGKIAPILGTATEAGIEAANSVQITSPTMIKQLTEHGITLAEIKAINIAALQGIASIDKNDNCLNAIGKAVVNVLIKTLTLSIIDWINGKNSDGPLFITDPSKFFKDIAKNEILGFGLEINDPNKFPFGKAFLMNEANKFNQRFADQAQYSLNELIQQTTPEYTAVSFSEDFSQGGWGAWNALTQVPYNNPLGFNLEASNELSKRLAGTESSTANNKRESLLQSSGILGQEYCASPTGLSKEEDAKARSGDKSSRICNKWEYSTPGKYVADHLTATVGFENHALLDAETLNDAIAAILDAAMARFSSKLMNEGMTALSNNNNDTSSSENIDLGYLFNQTNTQNSGTQFPESYMTPWLQNNPNFDLKTGVTQALVDEQRTYLIKLDSYNTALGDLIKWIRQLDYCIPGPNPDWENTTLEAINGNTMKSNPKWWQAGQGWYELGSTLSGGLNTTIDNLLGVSAKAENKDIATFLEDVLDVRMDADQTQITDKEGITELFQKIFKSYKNIINKYYFSSTEYSAKYMPDVTLESHAEFLKITGYQQIIENNMAEIAFRKSIITRLKNFKELIEQTGSNAIPDANFDDPSSEVVTAFARLSGYFVNGDDIANIDNLYKQTLDEKNYVKNNLLEGDFGCEKFLHTVWTTDKSIYSKYVRRQAYPYTIDHLYPGDAIEPYNIPYNSVNIQPMITPTNSGGNDPNNGFLYGAAYYNNFNTPFNELSFVIPITSPLCPEAFEKNDSGNIVGVAIIQAPLPLNIEQASWGIDNCGVVTRGFEKRFNVY